jgi:hypothetical protein
MRALFAVVALPRILALPQANGINRAMAFAGRIVVLFIDQLRIVELDLTGQAFSDAQFFVHDSSNHVCDSILAQMALSVFHPGASAAFRQARTVRQARNLHINRRM